MADNLRTSTEDHQQPSTTSNTPAEPEESQSGQTDTPPKKKSLYQRFVDAKTHRNVQIPEEDLVKYTGKTKAQLAEWADGRPGVAGNRAAGGVALGQASGFGGYEAAHGFGGWGPDAGAGKVNSPAEPRQETKNVEDEKDE